MPLDTKPDAANAAGDVANAAAQIETEAATAADAAMKNAVETAAKPGTRPTTTARPEAGTKAERKWIKKERKKLRKELKAKGITSRQDFENIAHDLGLVLDNRHRWLAWFWLWGHNLLSNLGLKSLLAATAAALALLFATSILSEQAGSFTVNLTTDMLYSGFSLCETPDFAEPSTRLIAEELDAVTNVNLQELAADVTETDGMSSSRDYIAYTFYIRNEGEEAADYLYRLNIESETQNLGDAIWIMLFEDDHQVIYARSSADGDAEEIYGYVVAPYAESAYDYSAQYYQENNKYGVVTTEFVSDTVVVEGVVLDIAPGEYKKYTVVIWVEGMDPECTNDLFGGYATLSMDFELLSAVPSGVFSGVYRTEYEY